MRSFLLLAWIDSENEKSGVRMRPAFKHYLRRCSFYLGGDQPAVAWVERLRSALGAFVGLMLVLTMAKYLGELSGLDEWLMASLGARALLLFALPGSPMAQPWAVVAGNTLSAWVGIAIIQVVQEPLLAMPLAASLSILGMFVLRCLHPPAAAVALIVVLGQVMHYRYAFFPVMVDSILLVLAGAVYSNLTGKRYPNKPE
jgi:CBS domain-containing membrane protein